MGVVLANGYRVLGWFESIILLDSCHLIINAEALVFGKEYYSYCLCHLIENFLKGVGKHGIQSWHEVVVKKMLYKVVYSLTVGEYNASLQELRCYKAKLGTWVENNEIEW